MLKSFKQNLLAVLRSAGVFRLIRLTSWRKQRLAILCYHGISIKDEHEWNPVLYMSPRTFRNRLEQIRRSGYRVLPLGEGVCRLREGSLPGDAVSITFDDGGYDFYHGAFPLLREFGMPSTVYLTTYYCYYPKPIFNIASDYILWKAGGVKVDASDLVGRELDLTATERRREAWVAVTRWAREKNLSSQEQSELLEILAGRLGVDFDSILAERLFQIMAPPEVAEVAAQGVDIQLHTHRHRTPADRELFRREVVENRERIQEITGNPGVHFCYPSGMYRPEYLSWLAEMEVVSATTCEPGLASQGTHPLLLPRFIDNDRQSTVEFEGWLSGASSAFPRNPWRPRRKPA